MGKNRNLANLYILLALLLIGLLPLGSVGLASAQPANLIWSIVDTPDIFTDKHDVVSPSEVNKLVVGYNGITFYCLDISNNIAYGSWNSGTTWYELTVPAAYVPFWDIAVAPDDVDFIVAISDNVTSGQGPKEVWVSDDGGANWTDTRFSITPGITGNEFISCVDISVDYGGKRDIAVGVRRGTGAGAFDIYVLQSVGFTGWVRQTVTPPGVTNGDVFALKFSPTYAADGALSVVFATAAGTYYNIALRDIDANDINQWVLTQNVEVAVTGGASPTAAELISADLELPSDFSGQAASLRRAYIATDSNTVADDGIFRIDDTTVYVLMDTSAATDTRRISSISYFGTYASGKLLAGEVHGDPCTATVPTWFTDSPTTCPIPCWYPALKPTTGAAGTDNCTGSGYGNAQVVWSPDGSVAYVGTSSANFTVGGASMTVAGIWPLAYLNQVGLDESAFGLSRNNGETWNQLSLIDTKIDKLTDVAVAPDCSTVYLASSNNGTGCTGFDSVWRSSSNALVVSPLPAEPVGNIWERVYCHVTATTCNITESNYAILRLTPDLTDGQIVFWAAGGTGTETGTTIGGYTVGPNTRAVFWSPDFGDYWAAINPRFEVQDMAAESKETLYILSLNGLVQKMPYTGISWATSQPSANTGLSPAHMIAVIPDGQVLVGFTSDAIYPVAVSKDGGASFLMLMQPLPATAPYDVHVAFDPAYNDNNIIFIADDSANGSVYRNNVGSAPNIDRWAGFDMMAAVNGATGSNAPHPVGQFGVQLAFTGADGQTALYSAHRPEAADVNSGVCRTLWPLGGMPKPGIIWDCLDMFSGAPENGVQFTLEPWSLKLCGCLTLDTDTTLWAIDNSDYVPDMNEGMLWANTDCLAKRGPALVTGDETLFGCDPVSGRNQEVDLCWEQLCIATGYDIEIAKDSSFTIRVLDWASVSENNTANFLQPADVLVPCTYIPAGGFVSTAASAIASSGNFECGHTYYWRVQVRSGAGSQIIRSPWSEARRFTLKAGLPVTAKYCGLTLLSPGSGSRGCPVNKMTFSWSPFVNSAKYKFVLAKDAAMTQVVTEADVAATAYVYEGTLEYGRNYFWRVMAIAPAPSDWSATFSFMTEAEPLPAASTAAKPKVPFWIWPIIAIFVALFAAMIALVMIKPKYRKPGTSSGGDWNRP